jgi:hypothetical protein
VHVSLTDHAHPPPIAHASEPIRTRALRNIVSKLDAGIVTIEELAPSLDFIGWGFLIRTFATHRPSQPAGVVQQTRLCPRRPCAEPARTALRGTHIARQPPHSHVHRHMSAVTISSRSVPSSSSLISRHTLARHHGSARYRRTALCCSSRRSTSSTPLLAISCMSGPSDRR